MCERERLNVGDEVWLLHGVSLYCAVVTDVRVNLVGDPAEFAMYRVQSQEYSRWFEDTSQHRSDLFRRSDERSALIAEIEGRIESLEQLRDEVEENAEVSS